MRVTRNSGIVFVLFCIKLLIGSGLLENSTDISRVSAASDKTAPIHCSRPREFLASAESTRTKSAVWCSDTGDGMYKNPILHADYSDPDVIRVDEAYYMTASSFTHFPGLPILRSEDLVNWQLIGYAVQRYPGNQFDMPRPGKGIWAPSIRCHEGRTYIYWGDPDAGIYRVCAPSPEGPWEPPTLLLPGRGLIDPCPFWDDDGRAYLVHAWAKSRAAFNSVLTLRNMSPDGSQISPEGTHIFDGRKDHPTIEGPKLYKRNGYYYVFAPAGGVSHGWQTVLRSKHITGPYEAKIVLEQGSTPINGPHQGGWVETPEHRSWFIHFQDAGAYGRILHLQPMTWKNDWPVIGIDSNGDGTGEPVLVHTKPVVKEKSPEATPSESDEFNTGRLGLQWHWQANPRPQWVQFRKQANQLRLLAIPHPLPEPDLRGVPNLLLQRFPAPDFQATAKMQLFPETGAPRAGLVITGDDYACIELALQGRKIHLRQVAFQHGKEQVVEDMPYQDSPVFLRVQISSPDALCRFSYSSDGQRFTAIGKAFTARPGRWVGARMGLFCISQVPLNPAGYADFDWFRVE